MFIKKLQVFNYKSYFDSGVMEFAPGVNIVVGRNNAGKTSLLEVLTLNFGNEPHKSLKTLPNKGSTIEEKSRIEITLQISTEEARNFIKNLSPNIGIPAPSKASFIGDKDQYQSENEDDSQESYEDTFENYMYEALQQFKKKIEIQDFLETALILYPSIKLNDKSLEYLLNFDSFPTRFQKDDSFFKIEYKDPEGISFLYDITLQEEDADIYRHRSYKATIYDSIGYKMFKTFLNRIYRFEAERLKVAICKFENNFELKSNASNLAEVICILQGKNPGRFAQFNELVSDILPEIKWISVVPRDNSDVEIIVWTIEPKFNRDDLSLPLSSCGSGVSQVLAIVYILVCSEEPRTLIIDEPQSFLHPGAAKKLIETIKQFPQHQYFIATHSPDIITTAAPAKIIKLQYQDCQTTALIIDAKEIESQNDILTEIGVNLSDFFGADNILWVEGQTEEKCFPLILDKVVNKQLHGTKILAVKHTGDLEGKRAIIIFEIYKILSEGTNLFPPAIGFLFDSDGRSEEDKTKWQDISKKPVEFLSRRMYENYLLDSEAIAAVLNEDNQSRPEPFPIHLTSAEVEEWLEKKKQEKGCSKEEWLSEVDGANLLKDLFRELSGSKLSFYKTKKHYNHSYKLTKWLVENKPDFLLGLAEEVAKMLNY